MRLAPDRNERNERNETKLTGSLVFSINKQPNTEPVCPGGRDAMWPKFCSLYEFVLLSRSNQIFP
jgi:hypothetical protein